MKNKTNLHAGPQKTSTFEHRSVSQSSTTGQQGSLVVLLVQGDTAARNILANQLRQECCTVFESGTGIEALEIAELKKPDLIFLDVRLPDADGFDTICALKEQPASSAIPIIAIGSPGLRHEKNRCLTAGATAWVFKPTSGNELWDLTRTLLQRNGRPEKSF